MSLEGPHRKLVAIVGRPNVGKSTLFNRLIGSRQAIVEDQPGVTRDRLYGTANWEGKNFLVVDTGGLDPSLETGIPAHIRIQAEVAIEEADLVLFLIDSTAGVTADDYDIAALLRRSGKPILVAANKADSPKRDLAVNDAYALGLGEVYGVSAAHGRGTSELCDAIVERVDATEDEVELVPPGTRIAFLGRPNAGKSTLTNALLEAPRVIVSETPGTTRDAVYLPLRHNDDDWVVIDTAGLRRRKQVARAHEKLAAIKSIRAMERTEIVVLVIDATEGVTDQDQRIARMAFVRGKGVVVLLHKWDLIRHDAKRARETLERTKDALGFLEKPWIVKTSVVGDERDRGGGKAFNLGDVLNACQRTAEALKRRISTSELNDELQAAVRDHSPPSYRGKLVRLYFVTQADDSPPMFMISANMGRCLTEAYEKYLLRRFRTRWGLRGVPVRLVVRARGRSGTNPRR